MRKLNFYKWDGGSRRATPILALHGFTGSGLDFECFVDESADFLSWWAVDLMGHGRSPVSKDPEEYKISAHIGYLDEIAKDIKKPFVLLGYSMGGRLALSYALERPEFVKQLVLVSASPGISDFEERRLRRESDGVLAESIEKEGVESFLKKWHELPIIETQRNIPDSLRSAMMERRARNFELGLSNSLRGMGTGIMEPLWDSLRGIECPVTLMTGEIDKKFFEIAEQMKNLVPSMIHEVIPGAGHAAVWENSSHFCSLLKSMFGQWL